LKHFLEKELVEFTLVVNKILPKTFIANLKKRKKLFIMLVIILVLIEIVSILFGSYFLTKE
jgi:hypothetical protein